MSGEFGPDSLPARIPIFPLPGALILPRGSLPLNIFEPRYLAMVRDAMANERLIGMVQPRGQDGDTTPLYPVVGLGRITQFSETGDGRFIIMLTGLTRFRIERELSVDTPYRQVEADYTPFAGDWQACPPLPPAERATLEETLRTYLAAQELSADWNAVAAAEDEALVNTLVAVCPFDTAEKQALLEAPDVQRRAATLTALMTFSRPSGGSASGTTLH